MWFNLLLYGKVYIFKCDCDMAVVEKDFPALVVEDLFFSYQRLQNYMYACLVLK